MRWFFLVLAVAGCAEEEQPVWGSDNDPTTWTPPEAGDVVAACELYVEAATDCANEAFGAGTSTYGTTGGLGNFCNAYADLRGQEGADARDYLLCLAEAYMDGDCSTAEGYTAAGTEAAGCVLGGR